MPHNNFAVLTFFIHFFSVKLIGRRTYEKKNNRAEFFGGIHTVPHRNELYQGSCCDNIVLRSVCTISTGLM